MNIITKSSERVKVWAVVFACFLVGSGAFSQQFKIEQSTVPEAFWQAELSFPDRQRQIDDTLSLNSLYAFDSFKNQSEFYVSVGKAVQSFSIFVNQERLDTSALKAGNSYKIDFSKVARDGKNILQVASVRTKRNGAGKDYKVRISIPYPSLKEGTPGEVGIDKTVFDVISEIIQSDVEHGFSSAQIAVAKNGAQIYKNSWGYLNSYDLDGIPIPLEERTKVTNDTLFDLASCTKVLSVNCALEYLISRKRLSLETKVSDILGEEFYKKTIKSKYKYGSIPGIVQNKKLKEEITIRDLVCHRAGFPPCPCYYNKNFNYAVQRREKQNQKAKNKLYAGCGADEKTRAETYEAVCKTPLLYKPGTKVLYSDVDYIILGFVVEKITGERLDEFCKKTFWEPLGLERIAFNPLQNGFSKEDCAATELRGNTRGGTLLDFEGRSETIQGEVHDETAYYSMAGISGHAGLFSTAENALKLLFALNYGGYGNLQFFAKDVIDTFFSPQSEERANWAVGWYHQGNDRRSWNFSQSASRRTVGHNGWTGTFVMIEPDANLQLAYFTSKRNTPFNENNTFEFDGSYFTSANYGFIPQLIFEGMTNGSSKNRSLILLLGDMAHDKFRLVDLERVKGEKVTDSSHPIVQAAYSILEVFVKRAVKDGSLEALGLAKESLKWLSTERDAEEIEKIKGLLK